MAKLPNRLVIEITNTDKVDELGNPVIGFESKDYAECVIEELEKIKIELFNSAYHNRISGKEQIFVIWEAVEAILNEDISELKGETE